MSGKETAYEGMELMAIAYANGASVGCHCHTLAQVIYAVSGVMEITADNKQWRVPPQRALWMPPRLSHSMKAHGTVELRTVYVPEDAVSARFMGKPLIIAASPLLRELILRGIETQSSKRSERLRIGVLSLVIEELELLLEESACAQERSLPLPSGRDKRITRICEAILADPGHSYGLEEWAREVGASKRTLARRFQSEFGMSFLNWRQQARVISALSRLDQGDPVTIIANDLGYQTSAAFSVMFRRLTGLPPSKHAMATRDHARISRCQNATAPTRGSRRP